MISHICSLHEFEVVVTFHEIMNLSLSPTVLSMWTANG